MHRRMRGHFRRRLESRGSGISRAVRTARRKIPRPIRADLLAYLKQTLIRIPCRFEFRTEAGPGDQINWQRHSG